MKNVKIEKLLKFKSHYYISCLNYFLYIFIYMNYFVIIIKINKIMCENK